MGPEPPLYVEAPAWSQCGGAHALCRVSCSNIVTEHSEFENRLGMIKGPPGGVTFIFAVHRFRKLTNED